MEKDLHDLVKAVWKDACKTWPDLIGKIELMETEAERLLAGGNPMGGPYMFLYEYMKKVGYIK